MWDAKCGGAHNCSSNGPAVGRFSCSYEPEKSLSIDARQRPVELSGKEMFKAYCASCHGEDAKGHGPAAIALKTAPPDLTLLAKRNKGNFSADYVNTVVLHGVNTPAHGSTEMPIWGPIFTGVNVQRLVVLRVNKISEYLETLQVK